MTDVHACLLDPACVAYVASTSGPNTICMAGVSLTYWLHDEPERTPRGRHPPFSWSPFDPYMFHTQCSQPLRKTGPCGFGKS